LIRQFRYLHHHRLNLLHLLNRLTGFASHQNRHRRNIHY
jgi:hypothetical protein